MLQRAYSPPSNFSRLNHVTKDTIANVVLVMGQHWVCWCDIEGQGTQYCSTGICPW